MKIELSKEEVISIMTEHVINLFNIDVSGKKTTSEEYYGGFRLEITDRFEQDK